MRWDRESRIVRALPKSQTPSRILQQSKRILRADANRSRFNEQRVTMPGTDEGERRTRFQPRAVLLRNLADLLARHRVFGTFASKPAAGAMQPIFQGKKIKKGHDDEPPRDTQQFGNELPAFFRQMQMMAESDTNHAIHGGILKRNSQRRSSHPDLRCFTAAVLAAVLHLAECHIRFN